MDNVTHSLAGLVVAEATVQLRARLTGAEPSRRFRTAAGIASMVAANLPDADLFYTGVGGDRLRYMLHHRGYTHTVIVAVIGAALLWGAISLLWRWRRRGGFARADSRWLLALLVVSALSHLVLDWTNSYGVHPFWPLDDRWHYGDAVFIVEPWLWVVAVPMLVAATVNRVARMLLALVLLAGIALAWRVAVVSTGAATALTAGALLSIAVARFLRPGPRVATSVAGWVAVTLVMAAGSATARATAIRAVHAADPATELLDVVVSPLPANAVCMSVITVERSGVAYRVVTARVSSAPSITAASQCGTQQRASGILRTSPRPSTAALQWDGEWTAPSGELEMLARGNCTARAALRFIRVPIWRDVDDSTFMLGDLRYGDASGGGFTDVMVARHPAVCPANVPPWVPPRAGLTAFVRILER